MNKRLLFGLMAVSILAMGFIIWSCGDEKKPVEPGPPGDVECLSDLDCMRSGCSGEVCASESMITACVCLPEYECLQIAPCACISGQCGFVETREYLTCMNAINNPEPECITDRGCVRSGCSGEICAPEPMASICIWLPEFECYQIAPCSCISGRCGFIETLEFLACMDAIDN